MFNSMTFRNWKDAVSPKVLGAMNLHSVLAGTPLDFFLTTSSISGTLGTPGQSNYAAANSYLDALARHRTSNGAAASSVILPMILGVGVVAENSEIEDALRRKGIYGIDEEDLLVSFEAALASSQVLGKRSDHFVIGLDPSLLHKAITSSAATDVFYMEDTRFSHLVRAINVSCDSNDSGSSSQSILNIVRTAQTLDDAVAAVREHFTEKLARMLLIPEDAFEPHVRSIASYGLDSMIGAELRNWIFKEYRIDIPFQQLLAPTLTITKFAVQVCAGARSEN